MAIKATITSDRGVIYPDQYIRVDQVRARKTDMDIEVGIYLTQQQAADGIPPHRIDVFLAEPFDMENQLNLWQQAYAAVKQQWPDSVDV